MIAQLLLSTWRLNADGRWRVVFDTEGDFPAAPEVLDSEPDCT